MLNNNLHNYRLSLFTLCNVFMFHYNLKFINNFILQNKFKGYLPRLLNVYGISSYKL